MEDEYKYTRGPYAGPMPPENKPTPNELAAIKQDEVVRSKLAVEKSNHSGEKEPKDSAQKELKEVMRADMMRSTPDSGKKPGLDFYDNKRDVKSSPGDKNPPHSGKFGTTYRNDRDHN